MFVAKLNMNTTDWAVSRAIRELHKQHTFISQRMIAQHINCDPATVYRSLRWMKEEGLVVVGCGGSRRGGHIYEYIGD
jgi:predicted transcriptional regulator